MSPLEQWLLDHEPTGTFGVGTRAPFSLDSATGNNVHKRPPLTHTELWARLIADSDYLEPFKSAGHGGPALTVAGTRRRLGAAHHV